MITYILAIIESLANLSKFFPLTCRIAPQITFLSTLFNRNTLTFYQITRLQYIFNDKNVHSAKFGYPTSLFQVLYIYGFIETISVIIITWFLLSVDNQCKIKYIRPYLMIFCFVGYYLWDLTVLLLYIIKIRIIQRKKYSNNNAESMTITKRINYVLVKITILTFLMEAYTAMSATCTVILSTEKQRESIIRELILAIDSIWVVLVLYFMMEYNDKHYFKLIKVLYKLRICFCFGLLGIITDKEEQNSTQSIKFGEMNSVDTKTVNPVPIEPVKSNETSLQSID